MEIIEEEEKLQNFGPTVKIWIILWTGLGSNLNFRHKAQAHFLVQATLIENFLPGWNYPSQQICPPFVAREFIIFFGKNPNQSSTMLAASTPNHIICNPLLKF